MQAEKIAPVVPALEPNRCHDRRKIRAGDEREAGPEVDGKRYRRGLRRNTECDGRTPSGSCLFTGAPSRVAHIAGSSSRHIGRFDRRHQLPCAVLRPDCRSGSQVGCERRPLRGESGDYGTTGNEWCFSTPEGVNSDGARYLALDYFYEITPGRQPNRRRDRAH